jgi:NAD(P)-dependent dehydrogenase (short-subunit alcohol dehydrogenase family)/acyl carrier protein
MTQFNISRDRIFNSRDASFLPGIMAATNNRGVDVVLNSLSGELLHASWKCVAEFGTFVDISRRDFIGQGRLAMEQFESNRTYTGLELLHLWVHRPQVAGAILQRGVDFWKQGYVTPVVAPTEFLASQISKPFRGMQQGQHIGKLVVSMPELHKFAKEPVYETLQLSDDRSYLFVGGLGGLGRAIAIWLVERGAGEILFLSRSAGSSPVHGQFVNELAALGCTAKLLSGDVTKYDDVVRAIKAADKPVGGVLQASLVLRDSNFLDMKWEDWLAASQPKIQGTWNLHNAFLSEQSNIPLDFFFLFSSTAATGGWYGQANYHAGNTFVESFAAYRHQLGLAASALNVGFIKDAGFVAENAGAADVARSMGQSFNTEAELLDCIELILKPARSKPSPNLKLEDGDSARGVVQKALLAMGMRSTTSVTSSACRIPWRKDRRMLAYRNVEAHELKSSSVSGSGLSSKDELARFMREIRSNIVLLQSAETAAYLAAEMGKALLEFNLRGEAEVDVQAPLAAIGLDSLVSLELRSWIRRWMGVELATLEITRCDTLQAVGLVVQRKLVDKYNVTAGG